MHADPNHVQSAPRGWPAQPSETWPQPPMAHGSADQLEHVITCADCVGVQRPRAAAKAATSGSLPGPYKAAARRPAHRESGRHAGASDGAPCWRRRWGAGAEGGFRAPSWRRRPSVDAAPAVVASGGRIGSAREGPGGRHAPRKPGGPGPHPVPPSCEAPPRQKAPGNTGACPQMCRTPLPSMRPDCPLDRTGTHTV